ncbi:hypothetical protein ScPMuIL_003635 [Solemya velum]
MYVLFEFTLAFGKERMERAAKCLKLVVFAVEDLAGPSSNAVSNGIPRKKNKVPPRWEKSFGIEDSRQDCRELETFNCSKRARLVQTACRNAQRVKDDFKQRKEEIRRKQIQNFEKKLKEAKDKELGRLRRLQGYTDKIIFYGLWQTDEMVDSALQEMSKTTEKKEALKAQLHFRKHVLKQNPPKEDYDSVFCVTRKQADGRVKGLTVEELTVNVKKLVEHAFTIPVRDNTDVERDTPLLISKTVRHKFIVENGEKWFNGTVVSQVPGYPSWYNIVYREDDAVYTYQLLQDWRKGDLQRVCEQKSITKFFASGSDDAKKDSVTNAECLMTHFIIEHNLPVSVADHMTHLFPKMFPDSKIANNFACKRTKTTHIIHETASDKVSVLKETLTRTVFSLATDGSSDQGAKLCIKRLLEQYEALSAFFKLESATKTPRKKSGKQPTQTPSASAQTPASSSRPAAAPGAKKRKLPHGFEATSTNPGGAKATSTNPEGAKADSSKAPSVAETDVDNKSTPVSKASTVNERLQDPRTKLYGLFLGHTLPVFNKFNLKLQSDEPQIHNVRSSCIDLLTNLLLRLIKPDVISSCKDITTIKYTDRKNQKSRDDLVIGAETRRYLEKCKKDETMTPEQRTEFFNAVRGYYAVAIKYILDKFPIQDDLLIHAEVADPSKRNSAKFQSLKYFTSRFPRLLQPEAEGDTDDLMNKLEMQFLLYQVAELPASLESLKRVDEVWSQLQQDSQYTLLSSVMLGILTLPHSNADSERVFSVVRKNQTVFRPNASRKLLESVLVVKSDSFARGSVCYEQTFDAAFLRKAKSATYVGLRDADDDVAAAVNVLPNVLRNL